MIIQNQLEYQVDFLILKINEIRETEKNINLDEELKKLIKLKTNEQLNQFSNIIF